MSLTHWVGTRTTSGRPSLTPWSITGRSWTTSLSQKSAPQAGSWSTSLSASWKAPKEPWRPVWQRLRTNKSPRATTSSQSVSRPIMRRALISTVPSYRGSTKEVTWSLSGKSWAWSSAGTEGAIARTPKLSAHMPEGWLLGMTTGEFWLLIASTFTLYIYCCLLIDCCLVVVAVFVFGYGCCCCFMVVYGC